MPCTKILRSYFPSPHRLANDNVKEGDYGSSHKMQPGQWSALVTCSPHLQVISRRSTSAIQPSGYWLKATQAAAALKIFLLLGTGGLKCNTVSATPRIHDAGSCCLKPGTAVKTMPKARFWSQSLLIAKRRKSSVMWHSHEAERKAALHFGFDHTFFLMALYHFTSWLSFANRTLNAF